MTKYNLEHFWEWIKEESRKKDRGIGFTLYDTQEQFLAAIAKKQPSETNIEKVFAWFLDSEVSNYQKTYEISEWRQAQKWKKLTTANPPLKHHQFTNLENKLWIQKLE